MSKYLYGASIQGIQSFIFQTNKLREIVGGSELVEEICSSRFYEFINSDEGDPNIILSAAGNIKYIADEETCKKLVRGFPKEIMTMAPGVTVSQAVVKINQDDLLSDVINQLEDKLKLERNKPVMPLEIGFMGLKRARRTGGVAVHEEVNRKGKLVTFCESTQKKANLIDHRNKTESKHTQLFRKISGLTEKPEEITLEIEEICKGHKNSWIAVVHADGNGLGKILRVMGERLKNKDFETSKTAFRSFSLALDRATQSAAQKAFWKVFSIADAYTSDGKYPIRPIVCGGDDLTFIIRADLALQFTEEFLKAFEIETKVEFKVLEEFGIYDFSEGLTACAGIAYIKESYPLHYALDLAKALCKDAKGLVKLEENIVRENGIAESALAFYKVQESFTESLSLLKERTLHAKQENKTLDYYYGPYRLNEIDQLNQRLAAIEREASSQEGSKAVGKIRKIVSDTYTDFSVALFNLERMRSVNDSFFKKLQLQQDLLTLKELLAAKGEVAEGVNKKSQLLDLITLHGFRYGTREN